MRSLALGNFDRQCPPTSRNRNPEDAQCERRLDAVRTNLRDYARQSIQLRPIERLRLTVIGHSQNQTAATVVGKRSQLVGQRIPTWTNNPVTSKMNFLQLQMGVLAERDLLPQSRYVDGHRTHQTPTVALSSALGSSWHEAGLRTSSFRASSDRLDPSIS